jgi:hypothetical protein
MMPRYGLVEPKIGLSGSIDDVTCFIAGIIEYQMIYNIKVEYFEGNTTEFEPDLNSEVYEDELV